MMKYSKLMLLAGAACLHFATASAQSGGSDTCLRGHYTMTGNANDASSYANHFTVKGATLTTDRFGNSNSAYYFNGSSSLYAPLDTRTFDKMTVTAWIKTTYTSQQSTIVQIVNPVLYTNRFRANKFFSSFDGSTQDNSAADETSTNVTNGEWIFVAAVCDGSTTKLYVNDSLESTFSETLYKSNGQMTIGLQSNNMWGFTGSIDEVRLYECALTDGEIADIYNAESKEPTGINKAEEINEGNSFVLYPNPAEGSLNIKLNITNRSALQIVDVTGRVIYTKSVTPTDKQITLDVSDYKAGVYFLHLSSDNKTHTQKLILK